MAMIRKEEKVNKKNANRIHSTWKSVDKCIKRKSTTRYPLHR